MNVLDIYKKSYLKKQFERIDLFVKIKEKFNITNALYPGSYVHITPSFVIPDVVYVDSVSDANQFFKDSKVVEEYIEKNKIYESKSSFRFIYQDYAKPLDLPKKSFDMLISLWAGPISQACTRYLKPGGILLANNSHADAGLAFLDPVYELMAAVHFRNGKFRISEKDLASYFIPKNNENHTIAYLLKTGKGIGYKKTANSYIFRKCT